MAQAGASQSLVQKLFLRERGEPGGSSAGEDPPPRIILFLGELQCCHQFSKSSLLSVPVPEWPAKRRRSGPSPHAMEVALISEPCVSSAYCTSGPCTSNVSPVCMPCVMCVLHMMAGGLSGLATATAGGGTAQERRHLSHCFGGSEWLSSGAAVCCPWSSRSQSEGGYDKSCF